MVLISYFFDDFFFYLFAIMFFRKCSVFSISLTGLGRPSVEVVHDPKSVEGMATF